MDTKDRVEVLKIISEILKTDNLLTESTVIADSSAFDSISLMELYVYLKANGFKGEILDFLKCKTVKDLVNVIIEKF